MMGVEWLQSRWCLGEGAARNRRTSKNSHSKVRADWTRDRSGEWINGVSTSAAQGRQAERERWSVLTVRSPPYSTVPAASKISCIPDLQGKIINNMAPVCADLTEVLKPAERNSSMTLLHQQQTDYGMHLLGVHPW